MEWIIENKEWIFSGIGIFILGIIINFFIKKNSRSFSQRQKSGDNSTNIQIGGNVEINKKDD